MGVLLQGDITMSQEPVMKLASLIEVILDSLLNTSEKLETNTRDLENKIASIKDDISSLKIAGALLEERINNIRDGISTLAVNLASTNDISSKELEKILDRLSRLENWSAAKKEAVALRKEHAKELFRAKLVANLGKVAAVIGAGAAGGGLSQLIGG